MRVLILTTHYLPRIGGSELAIKNLTQRLPQVTFDIVSAGWGGKWLLPITGLVKGLRRRYDIVHAFQASYGAGAGVLLKLVRPRVPFIVSLQEGKELDTQSAFVRFFRGVILRRADVITSISRYLQDYAKKINPKAEHVLLPNGVEIRKMSNDELRMTKNIITSSRLVHKNGIDTLIRAVALVPDCRLQILGDGKDRAKLEALTRKLDIADRVTFAGTVAHEAVSEHLAHASLFVRPSRSEGLGNAFLEAMAAGVPIVGTPVGGIPDFLKDPSTSSGQATGLFCKVDDAQSVADAIRELLENKALRERIVANALKLVKERYDWDILAKQYYETLRHHSGI